MRLGRGHVERHSVQAAPGAPCRPEIEHRLAGRSSPYLTTASSTADPPEVTSDVTAQSP